MEVSWGELKDFVVARMVSIQWVQLYGRYHLRAYDGNFYLFCNILISTPAGEEQTEFETTYKLVGNKKISQIDSDGASLARTKAAPTGWTFQLRGFEYSTSTLASIINLDHTGSTLSDISIKLYNGSGVEITTPGLANINLLSCVKTVIDFEPPYDYYIIGAKMRILSALNSDVRITAVVVPDVPYEYGGTRILAQNVNFRYLAAGDKFDADGRAAKFLAYSAITHTNKIRIIVTHAAGAQHSFSVNVEHFKF